MSVLTCLEKVSLRDHAVRHKDKDIKKTKSLFFSPKKSIKSKSNEILDILASQKKILTKTNLTNFLHHRASKLK